jgi:hypothetical protein
VTSLGILQTLSTTAGVVTTPAKLCPKLTLKGKLRGGSGSLEEGVDPHATRVKAGERSSDLEVDRSAKADSNESKENHRRIVFPVHSYLIHGWGASGQNVASAKEQKENAAGFKEFTDRVQEYVKLHKAVEANLPDLKPTDLPEMITAA